MKRLLKLTADMSMDEAIDYDAYGFDPENRRPLTQEEKTKLINKGKEIDTLWQQFLNTKDLDDDDVVEDIIECDIPEIFNTSSLDDPMYAYFDTDYLLDSKDYFETTAQEYIEQYEDSSCYSDSIEYYIACFNSFIENLKKELN